jgi:hypothetical protein
MFKLFENIFEPSRPKADRLPEDLLDAAVERAVDGTDPRLKMLPAYDRKLRGPVARAVQYVIRLVDELPAAEPLQAETLASNPALAAIFYSAEQLQRIVEHDTELKSFRKLNPLNPGPVNALLLVNTTQKKTIGTALVDDKMRKDVVQTSVDFHDQRFMAPARIEAETRDLLKRRAFDHLLLVAMSRIARQGQQRQELQAHRAVMQSKLRLMTRSGGFHHQHGHGLEEQAGLQGKMEKIEQQLAALGPDEKVLPSNLAMVLEVLENAKDHLWLDHTSLCLDRYYVLHSKPERGAPAIEFMQLHGTDADTLIIRLVALPPG